MKRFQLNDERPVRLWSLRIASVLGVVGLVATSGHFFTKAYTTGDVVLVWPAVMLLLIAPPFAWFLSWMWKDTFLAPFEWAKRHAEGVEGDHRHEWYAFRGQRVRVFLDEEQRPWFALNELQAILSIEPDERPFRHYRDDEYGTPPGASEPCLSEVGLRRLLKYSKHPDALALTVWLDREVMFVLNRRRERLSESI